jgi:hypothetical protein
LCIRKTLIIDGAISIAWRRVGSAIGKSVTTFAGIGRTIAFTTQRKMDAIQILNIASKVLSYKALKLGEG